jgi:hypothetical protein
MRGDKVAMRNRAGDRRGGSWRGRGRMSRKVMKVAVKSHVGQLQ